MLFLFSFSALEEKLTSRPLSVTHSSASAPLSPNSFCCDLSDVFANPADFERDSKPKWKKGRDGKPKFEQGNHCPHCVPPHHQPLLNIAWKEISEVSDLVEWHCKCVNFSFSFFLRENLTCYERTLRPKCHILPPPLPLYSLSIYVLKKQDFHLDR